MLELTQPHRLRPHSFEEEIAVIRSRIGAALTGLAAVTSFGLLAAPAAHAQTDCETKNVEIRGARGGWTICRYGWNSRISVDGWVKDTLPRFGCGEVYAQFSNGVRLEQKDCGNDPSEFYWAEDYVSDVKVYLRRVG
jgi:hypothetical protein